MKEHVIKSNGINIQAYEYSFFGEPILFLHYMNGVSAIWNQVIPQFTDNYRVIAMDLRGHGKSDQPESGYEVETMAKDILDVLDYFKIDQVNIVGSSLGATIGTCFAYLYPKRVKSLVNSEGGLINRLGEGGLYEESRDELIRRYIENPELEFDSKEAFLQYMKENWLPWNDARRKVMEYYEPRQLPNNKFSFISKKSTLTQIFESFLDIKLENWYEKINCPVLFLPSDNEEKLDKKLLFIAKIKSLLPISKTVIIPQSDHAMMFDHSHELTTEIKNFYDNISRVKY